MCAICVPNCNECDTALSLSHCLAVQRCDFRLREHHRMIGDTGSGNLHAVLRHPRDITFRQPQLGEGAGQLQTVQQPAQLRGAVLCGLAAKKLGDLSVADGVAVTGCLRDDRRQRSQPLSVDDVL